MLFHHPQHWFLVLQSLMFAGAESISEVSVKCGETASLPCPAQYKSEIQYRAISWYKVADDGVGLIGIVRKDFKENIARMYLGFSGSVEVASASPYFLTIHNISSEDLGTYQCSLWAPLGEQNKEADVRLREMDHLWSSKEFEGQLTILCILTILGSTVLICVVIVSIKCARNREVAADYKKFNEVQVIQHSTENCYI